jgi:hypothetical protein
VKITSLEPKPFHSLRYRNAAPGGGTETARLPFTRGTASGLPEGVDAVVLASDLQGIVAAWDGLAELLGVAVAQELEALAYQGLVPAPHRIGVVLAGDLYSVPEANKRGGYGDVRPVWRAFSDRFAWVLGVAGNHDDVGRTRGVLDGDTLEVGGVRFGGVGLITGDPRKPGRREEADHLAHIELLAEAGVDVLVLHQGPEGDAEQPGHAGIAEVLGANPVPLVVCGHIHWANPLWEREGRQVVNVDTRVVVLGRAS